MPDVTEATTMDPSSALWNRAIEAAKTHGFPLILLLGILGAIWRAAEWSANNVVTPLVTRQMAFMDGMQKAIEGNSAVVVEMRSLMVEAADINKQNQELIKTLIKEQGYRHEGN